MSTATSATSRATSATARATSANETKTNPEGLRRHLKGLDETLQRAVMRARTKGVLRNISKYAFATPHGVKANCYAFFLTLPDQQWQDRLNKTQPGDSCGYPWAKTRLHFASRGTASNQLIRRVACDNPGVVNYIHPTSHGYRNYILNMKLPRGYILGCCIVGGQDYHFCRREGIRELLQNPGFLDIWTKSKSEKSNAHRVQTQLQQAEANGHSYCWSHVAGWSGRLKLVDAQKKIILNPVDKHASGKAVRHLVPPEAPPRCDHNYPGGLHYDTFVGFFLVKARSAKVTDGNKLPRNEARIQHHLRTLGMSEDTVSKLNEGMRSTQKR